jgi:CRP-like cAMP-binding protein
MSEKSVEFFTKALLGRGRAGAGEASNHARLFHGLADDSLEVLLSSSHIADFPEGQEIVQQGDTPAYMYYINQGRVKTLRYSAEGKEATFRLLSAGETFMEAVIFMGGQSPVNAKAIESSKLLLIPAETVRRHARQDSQFACNLLKIVTRHYKEAMQQIDSIVTKNPVNRLGYYFLKQHLAQDSASMDVAIPFQKSVIANHLGMTPETFSRALHQMKGMGIDVDQDNMTLKNAYALCHFCDSDTAHDCPNFKTEMCPLSSEGGICHPHKHAH